MDCSTGTMTCWDILFLITKITDMGNSHIIAGQMTRTPVVALHCKLKLKHVVHTVDVCTHIYTETCCAHCWGVHNDYIMHTLLGI